MEKSPRDSPFEGCEMMAFRFRIPLFAVIFFTLAIPNAFSDGKVHVEGQFTLPFPSKKTIQKTKTWFGLVVGVSDGDTITVLHEGKGEKIRLYGIDTPEEHQAFGKKAKPLFIHLAQAQPAPNTH